MNAAGPIVVRAAARTWLAPGTAGDGFHDLWGWGGFVKKCEGAGEQGLRELQAQLLPLQHRCATWRGLTQRSG